MPCANIGDAKIYYEIYGHELDLTEDGVVERPTIVVMHGGPGIDHTFEVEFYRECAPFAQVILYDHRGNGRSSGTDPKQWNLTQWADDLHQFCETLGLTKPFIDGVSMGGWVALNFAMRYPGYAAGIILRDTEGRFDVERVTKAFASLGGDEYAEIARKAFGKEIPSAEVFEDYFSKCIPLCSNTPIPESYVKRAIMKPELMTSIQQERYEFNYLPELYKITDPVLYLTNTISPCHLLEVAKETAAAMSNAEVTFVAFDDCGIVQHDAKEAAIAEINKFVSEKNCR
jgi:proline iminopeptidase